MPSTSVIISSLGSDNGLGTAVRSVLDQEQADVECIVARLDGTTEQVTLSDEIRQRVTVISIQRAESQTDCLNRAFSKANGEAMLWLNASEKLCPWACRVASFVLANLGEVQWLTSSTPIVWSGSGLCLPNGYSAGYTRESFFAGRNLRSSPNFQHRIWREGTFWRHSLWESIGGCLNATLEEAGDFELWIRFWESAELATLSIPLGGPQTAFPEQPDPTSYWNAASRWLAQTKQSSAASPLTSLLKSQLSHRVPGPRPRWGYPAPNIWITPATLECGLSWHTIS